MGDDNDDDTSESFSTLPWHWVIEALAGFKEITISTLQGLIDASPVGPDDFSENIRELVTMRCLEELYASSAKGVNLDASPSSTLDSRVRIDFSRTCEDALQEILHEVPLSNLRMAGAELLKWDVPPFIMHKRAGTVKCHLEQLKESILEGTQPLTDHLKERSGLFQRNRDHTVHVNDGEGNDHPEKDDGNSTFVENMGAKENSVSLMLKDGNKSSEECLPDNNLLSSKRNRVHSDYELEHYTRYLHEKQVCTNECDDFLRIKKRIKCYASTGFDSKKEKPVSQLGKEVSENSTEKILLISEKGGHHTENNNRAILRDGPLEDSHNRCTASNLSQPSSHNEVSHHESNTPCNATLIPQHTFGGENSRQQQVKSIVALPCGTQQKTSGSKPWSKHETDLQLEDSNGSQQTVGGGKAQDDTDNGFGVGISGDNTIAYQGEKINLIMKQHEEKNPNMKCNKGGQLLVCEPTTAPLLVPESCLGMTTKLYPQHTFGVEPCHDTSMDETNDAVHVEPTPTNDGNANKIQYMSNESQPKPKESNVASLNASQKPVASDKAVVDTVNGCGAELSSDSDGYHNEKIDLVAKKDEFLSSQHTVGHDLSAMTESTKQNFCMKCNEAGQLLVCKTTTCSLMVHKNCLSASAQLDEKGNFFCPFCAYSHTISEYLEAKKKASLARKELAIFINKGIRKQAVEHGQEFSRQEHSLSRKNYKCEHFHLENNRNDPLTVNEENIEDHVGEHANEVNNFHFERRQQQAPISVVHSSGREKENVNNGLADHVREEDEGETLNGRIEDKEVSPDHVGGHDDENFSCKKANIVPASNAGDEVPQNMTEHNINGTVEPVCAHDTKKEEISEDECKRHSIPKYSMRFRKHEIQYKTPPSPQIRRKNIPWTAEEEELIREGVQKFAFSDPKIPWKKILAFGSHLFEKDDKRRTPQDLKDKWKNMCKAHSKLN